VVTSISTIALYLAYGLPILLNLKNRLRGKGIFASPDNAPWSLGRFAPFLNTVAVVWVAFIAVVFCLPPNELVLWTMLLFCVALGTYWLVSARRTFRGPAGA
jgi:L-asparagine transporter-like permease